LAGPADIEHEADQLAILGDEVVGFPVNNDWLINGVGAQS